MSFPVGAGARLPRGFGRAGPDLDHVEHQHVGVSRDDLRQAMHHDLARSQSRGRPLAADEPMGQERLDDLLDGIRRRQEVDIDRRPRIRVDRHRDAATDRVRNPRAAEGAHDDRNSSKRFGMPAESVTRRRIAPRIGGARRAGVTRRGSGR